ncbi:MAG: choice-of-anchor A family protein [Herbinix sp.]|nr:choice-of-anchor A family protein [Herbinix sp.]
MNNFYNNEFAGLPYDNINWYDVVGQPFGIASYFNAIIFGNADNIVDTKGAMAVGGNFVSSRGLSLAYGNDGNLTGTGYSPDLVRFLVGENVAMQGPLVVIGHVVAGGNFRAARGSTYMIGKDGSANQIQELTALYQADGGSKYWSLSNRGSHYAVSSYDIPRYIPASRIGANVSEFFKDAKESISNFKQCITGLQPNGTVTEHYHEWILQGNDPMQNVFLIDVRPSGILNKEIRFEIPQGSLAIVIFRTGNHAHLQYGLMGDEGHVNNTLYVFEDAAHIHMEVPAAIWGSILAPQAMFHAHQTGGNVNGNAALGSFTVKATSGFEFHLYPFIGEVVCLTGQTPVPMPLPSTPEQIPAPMPLPSTPEQIPVPMPLPSTPVQIPQTPVQVPCPTCPQPEPCPIAAPCPTCPQPEPCPIAAPCPTCKQPEPCPIAAPCPTCPQPEQCPSCPTCPTCPTCPPCPAPESKVRVQPIPIPIPIPIPNEEKCEECRIIPGVIFGCVWGCSCSCNHEWEVKIYRKCGENRTLLHCIKICSCGCFQFEVPYDDFYLLKICPIAVSSHRHSKNKVICKPMITLKNIGVANFMME